MKEVEELMPSKIGVNEICLFRKGSDIDLDAIFEGHIAGKKINGVKTNPVFKDGKNVRKGNNSDIENDMGGIEIQVYNSIPKSSLISKTNYENIKMKEELTKENSRDKVTVTNGDVCIGDIIIENGYRNPAFTLDTDSIHEENDVLEHTVKYTGEGEGRENLAGTEWPDLDDLALPSGPENQDEIKTTNTNNDEAYEMIDYNRNNKKTKNEIDSSDIQIDIISENVGGDEVLKVQTIASIKETENSERVPSDIEKDEIDTQNVNKSENENQLEEKTENDLSAFQISDEEKTNLNSPSSENSEENITKDIEKEDTQQTNGTVQQKTNDTLHTEPNLNGLVCSNFCVDEFIQQNDIVNESKDKSKKKTKKIKERKNSLPDHILNSLNKKPSKPILVPVVVDDSVLPVGRSRSTDNSNEHKSVKFSDDTVFNDLKPNKYKQERVSLKDIYKGKISSKEAVAKMNPVFVDEDNRGLTDDEKVEKCRQNDLNAPAYLKDYILDHQESNSVPQTGLEVDNDIESIGSEGAVNYDRLIKQTLAKRRKSRLRFTCAVITFLIVVAVVVVLVLFVGNKS